MHMPRYFTFDIIALIIFANMLVLAMLPTAKVFSATGPLLQQYQFQAL
jgi:hypothetical protein